MNDKEYLLAVKIYLTRYYSSELVSIILFGSLADNQGDQAPSTDVDLLIIIKDTCPIPIFNKINRELLGIESQYKPTKNSFYDLFRKGLQNATGMFINLFICRHSDFTNRNFTGVFGVNPVMAFLFAPKTSVWRSLEQRHRIIWGEEIFAGSKEDASMQLSDVLRSFAMNSLLSLGAISLSFIMSSMTQFAMEAVKWSLFTWKNYSNLPNTSLPVICGKYARNASTYEKRLLSAFLNFRQTQKPDKYLLLLAPLFVIRLHHKLIQQMRVRS
ncbi:hypothetical protein CEE45_11230 [Candidatus Heimdallarchaeota archaeon B3_Heim]|nr:MAG: hypothetical protein CEE45_11230 [Candidatus Heimdallarchaeota archaeon B3_Heim]